MISILFVCHGKILLTTAQKKGIVVPVQTLGVHIAETLPSLLEPDNTGVRKQYENMDIMSRLGQIVTDCYECAERRRIRMQKPCEKV